MPGAAIAKANSSCFLRRSVTTTSRKPVRGSKLISTRQTPPRSYSESKRSIWPGFIGKGSLTSPMSWQGLSSKQTTGRKGS